MNVLVGVTGCIAIYKAVGLVSLLRKQGYDLRVVMTESAEKMVSKDVFSAVGGCPVYADQDAFSISDGWIPHTELSKWADILVIAPATANTASKLAHGIADNLLSLTCLAYEKPTRIIVPAMNVRMYENPVTKRNLDILKQDGWIVLEPEIGHLACGETGSGRYPDNEFILEAVRIATCKKLFSGQKLLITAGPTSEPLDPVRVLTNRSSGKTGYTLATVAKRLGAKVCLISGPV
ncbi:MAG: bifunctional phosphopantothenoylcysteine decarboxylase/phosphopantothenate--cysteine ligase CoaBC, partial [Thermotogae bacterium]